MNVTVTYRGSRQSIGPAVAVAVVAAALRDGHTVTAVNPDLFAIEPAVPAWIERIAAAAAFLL